MVYSASPIVDISIFTNAGIDSLFSKIGCDATAITELLGGHAGVTDTTVLQYLGIVEQRSNELLQLQAFIRAKVSRQGWSTNRHVTIVVIQEVVIVVQ